MCSLYRAHMYLLRGKSFGCKAMLILFSAYCTVECRIGTLSKRGQQRKRREARKIFLRNPRILLSISLLWLPCMVLFSLKFRWLQRLLLNETIGVSSWNVDHVLKTAWKWSSWSLIWEQDGTNVSFISHIHVHFWSSVIGHIFCLRCRPRLFCWRPLTLRGRHQW